jgi:hypothetical protein
MSRLQDFLMDRVLPGWRERRGAQNPFWSMVEQAVVLVASWRASFWLVDIGLDYHFRLFPADLARYGEGQPLLVAIEVFLVWGVAWCGIAIALNAIEARIPTLRRLAEQGSDRFPELKVDAANRTLFRAAGVIGAVAGPLGICLIFGAGR